MLEGAIIDVELGTYAVAKRESGEWRPTGEERSLS